MSVLETLLFVDTMMIGGAMSAVIIYMIGDALL